MKILILSDIHANYPALQSVLSKDGDFDHLLFLGDVVDYGPNPKECLRFIRDNADYYVRGNHDNAIGYQTDCNCMGTFREFSIATREWHNTILNEDDKKFLRGMPILNEVHYTGKRFFLGHASPKGDLFKYLSEEDIINEIENIIADFVLIGHTHIQYQKRNEHIVITNPGSVGLARDCGEACYAIYENGKIQLKKISYDVDKTIFDLMNAPIPDSCKEGIKKVLNHKQ